MVTEPLVGIITPAFNDEEYLAECIESVLAQTYSNWHYVIVNNCSQDRSLEIALRYAARDSRIRVCNNTQHLRVVQNHNHALRQLSPESKYCKMVFADDWIFPDCLRLMVELAEAHPSVGLVGAYSLFGDSIAWDGLPYPSTLVPGAAVCRLVLQRGRFRFGTATSLLMRADLVRSRPAFYNESNLHADTEACYEMLKTSDFGFVHQVLSYIRKQEHTLRSFSQKFNTYLAGDLNDLVTFGPYYLEEEEYRRLLAEHLDAYYTFLAWSVGPRQGADFWRFHRKRLSDLGQPFRYRKIAPALARRALSAFFNPKRTAQGLWSLLKRGPRRGNHARSAPAAARPGC